MEKIKNLAIYIIAAGLVTICSAFLFGWPILLVLFFFGLILGLYLLRPIAPKIASAIGAIAVLIIVGGWAWTTFIGHFSIFASSLPMGSDYQQTRASQVIRPPLADVKVTLINELRKKEAALAANIPNLMKEKKYDELKKEMQEIVDQLKLVPQTNPPPAPAANITSAASPIGGQTFSIELKPDQVYDVDNIKAGQQFRYLSFNGAFSHRVDKGDGQACWRLIDNNLPFSADYAGKLQIKAGNIPVKLTVNFL